MKKIFKSLVSLTAAGTMLLSTTAFAAENLSTVTKYNAGTATVTSTVKSTKAGEMITYLATTKDSDSYDVNATGSNIVYIGQQTATAKGQELKFEYNLTGVAGATYALVRSGSSEGRKLTSEPQYVGVYDVTVNVSGPEGVDVTNAVTVTGGTNVGVGDDANITLEANTGYEIVKVTVNDVEKDLANTIAVPQGSVVTVKVVPTTGNPAVYVLDGATVETDSDYSGDKYSVISGVVKIVGDVKACDMLFYNNSERVADSLLKIDETAKFAIFDIGGSGYYGVELVGTPKDDISSYIYAGAQYTVKDDIIEHTATVIK